MDVFANIQPKSKQVPITPSARPKVRTTDTQWEPTALNESMLRLMDFIFIYPRVTNEELGELVGFSPQHVSKVRNSDIFKERYKQRRAELERLETSRLMQERERFLKLRDEMITEHEKLIHIDASKHGVAREAEFQRIRQKSIGDLLKVSTEEVGRIDDLRSRGPDGNGTVVELGIRTVQTGQEAYQELLARFRRGTK